MTHHNHRPDKWNTSSSTFYPGPQPVQSMAPQGPGALYSGLLECPLTTRVRKNIQANYVVKTTGSCGDLTIDTAAECYAAVAKLLPKGTAITSTAVTNATMARGCSVEQHAPNGGVVAIFNRGGAAPAETAAAAAVTCGTAPTSVTGATSSLVNLTLSLSALTNEARISMSGPAGVWFGVGFNAQQMSDEPWAIIVDGTSAGAVTERKLVDQKAGTQLKATVTVISNDVVDNVRTVKLTRSLKGATADYYTFQVDGASSQLPFINAVGSGPDFAYHKVKAPSMLTLLPVAEPACVCQGKPMPFGDGSCKGTITYVATNQTIDSGTGTVNFNNECAPDPLSQLRSQKNPTCDLRTYTGGQLSCHHMWSLLDADQEIPWPSQPLEYRFKFRFWYQQYTPATPTPSHKAIGGGWGSNVGAGGGGLGAEFDVPKCAAGVPGCSVGSDGTWVHTVIGIQTVPSRDSGELVAAHMHCHAPTCLSMSIANNATGEMICESVPTYGGNNPMQPHPKKDKSGKFQEDGFLAVPPCLWGSPKHGLEPSPKIAGTTLRIVKRSNATWGHHGEMAHGQFYYAN